MLEKAGEVRLVGAGPQDETKRWRLLAWMLAGYWLDTGTPP